MWSTVGQTQDWLYRGGFALIALVNVALVQGAIVAGPVRTVMSVRPLRYVGRISYGLYLYHWPIFLWLDAERTGLDPVPLFLVRCAITFALATASLVFLEMPIRERRMFRSWSYGAALAGSVAVVLLVVVVFVPTRSEAKSTVGQDLARNLPVASTSPTAVTTENRPLRVYIYGDSTGDQFALGLYDWSLAHPGKVEIKANVRHTCAFTDVDAVRFNVDGDADQVDCKAERAQVPAELDEFKPDVAWVISGPSNVTDVRLPGDDTWRALGDPAVDQYFGDGMANLTTEFRLHGVPTVWFDLPYSDRFDAGADDGFVANDRGRIDRYNELVAQLIATQPTVTRMDWAERINALAPDEDTTLRADGMHVLPALLGGAARRLAVAGPARRDASRRGPTGQDGDDVDDGRADDHRALDRVRHLGPAERTLHQEHQRLLHVQAVAGVAEHDGHVGRHRQRLAHLARVVAVHAVEEVDRDDERDAEVLEVVDRREAVLDAAGVDEHDAADRAPHQLVPEEQEAVLARACRTGRAPCRARG